MTSLELVLSGAFCLLAIAGIHAERRARLYKHKAEVFMDRAKRYRTLAWTTRRRLNVDSVEKRLAASDPSEHDHVRVVNACTSDVLSDVSAKMASQLASIEDIIR